MKRIIAAILILIIMVVTLCACGNNSFHIYLLNTNYILEYLFARKSLDWRYQELFLAHNPND